MESDDKPRSIRFPQWLWDEIDRDAQRCKRSSVKQMEVVLRAYYRGEHEDLNLERLPNVTGKLKIIKSTPLEMSHETKKRKTKTG